MHIGQHGLPIEMPPEETGSRDLNEAQPPYLSSGAGEGSTIDLDAPPGAGCMSGGVPPCGLDAGAPPVPVVSGPVHPWGWSWPLLSGNTARPVLCGESPGFLSSLWAWA